MIERNIFCAVPNSNGKVLLLLIRLIDQFLTQVSPSDSAIYSRKSFFKVYQAFCLPERVFLFYYVDCPHTLSASAEMQTVSGKPLNRRPGG